MNAKKGLLSGGQGQCIDLRESSTSVGVHGHHCTTCRNERGQVFLGLYVKDQRQTCRGIISKTLCYVIIKGN